MKTGICNLCLKKKPLLSKSHIFPNFLIKDIVNEKHQVMMMNVEDLKSKKVQSNYWESNILCENCDNKIISKLERYFEINLYSNVIDLLKDEIPPLEGFKPLRVQANFNRIKLFFLSILWRCSIINRRNFPKIELGPHQETFRKIIFENQIISQRKYPFIIFTFINKNSYADMEKYATIHTSPKHAKDENGHRYRYLFPGFSVEIYISDHNLPKFIDGFIDSEEEVLIGIINEEDSKKYINRALGGKVF